MDAGAIVARLEIDAGSTPIRGRLTAASGQVAAFTGWVGLAAAIEQIIALGETPTSKLGVDHS